MDALFPEYPGAIGGDSVHDEGVFYRPGQTRRYGITLDHKPQSASFEASQDDSQRYVYRLKASDGSIVLLLGPFDSREDALTSIEVLRESILAAETVETG